MWTLYLTVAVCGFLAALILMPLALRVVKPFVSPYQKADYERRFLASFVDLWVMVACYTVLVRYDALLAVMMSPLYLVMRDALFRGQSCGKLMVGLVTVQLETGLPVGLAGSLRRNFFFAIPGTSIVAFFFEARQMHTDEQGMRLGDRLARTQVVHGKEAIDLVRTVTDAILRLIGEIRGVSPPEGRPRAQRPRRSDLHARSQFQIARMRRTWRNFARVVRRRAVQRFALRLK